MLYGINLKGGGDDFMNGNVYSKMTRKWQEVQKKKKSVYRADQPTIHFCFSGSEFDNLHIRFGTKCILWLPLASKPSPIRLPAPRRRCFDGKAVRGSLV